MKYTKKERFLIWLDSFSELEYRKKASLYEAYGKDGRSFEATATETLGAEDGRYILNFFNAGYMKSVLAALEAENIVCITRESEEYPKDLSDVPYPPLVLYAKGNTKLLNTRKFAIVGSRRSTPLALAKAEEFAAALTQAGFTVVTGIADGADTAVIRGALQSGKIISVLAGGFRHIYPACNAALFRETAENGLVLSEYPPEVKAERFHFPVRNRIIAALGEGLLVVPYNVNVPSGEGCNEYIRQGAILTTCPEDILDFYKIEGKKATADPLTEEEREIYDVIRQEGEIHIDAIAERTGKRAFELMPVLGILEIRKMIIRQAGNVYCVL